MQKHPFIGRKKELLSLHLLFQKQSASLVVLQGRRRIGKSRFAEEFAKNYFFISLSGLPPSPGSNAQSERDLITSQLSLSLGVPLPQFLDWNSLFFAIAQALVNKKAVLLLDEISWMGSCDPIFLSALKTSWDLYFSKNPQLVVILCGSVSLWISENILSSTGFMGRISLYLTLSELSLQESCQFLLQGSAAPLFSPSEIFQIIAVTGGVPRYLEEILPNLSALENIKRLCFSSTGILFHEFDKIFSDLFHKKGEFYKSIVLALSTGSKTYSALCESLNLQSNGHLSKDLEALITCGFLSKDFSWLLSSGKPSRLAQYRLSDNYLRFYSRYILPQRPRIEQNLLQNLSLLSLPGYESLMGLQFENCILNNRQALWKALQIHPCEIISNNPFFQSKTATQKGCQIDYLIHTKFQTLYCFEINFTQSPVGTEVIAQVQEKIQRLKIPKGFAILPVLISLHGATEAVVAQRYFKAILTFEELLGIEGD